MRQFFLFCAVVGAAIFVTGDDGWDRLVGFYLAMSGVILAFIAASRA